jgi:hypothetical protein
MSIIVYITTASGIVVAAASVLTVSKAAKIKNPVSEVIREAAALFDEWLRAVGISAEQRREQHAPRGLLIDMCMPPDRAEDVIYNLLGRYDHWVEKHGERWARIIFFLQSAGSIGTFWTDWLLKRVKLLKMFVSS